MRIIECFETGKRVYLTNVGTFKIYEKESEDLAGSAIVAADNADEATKILCEVAPGKYKDVTESDNTEYKSDVKGILSFNFF